MREPLSSRLLFPVTERGFTYKRYEAWLRELADRARFTVVALAELAQTADPETVVVGLRHDVDTRLDSALELAELEHRHGVRATYFVLHTAPYYERRGDVLEALRRIQELGHEIGWHNDLVTLQCVHGIDPVAYLRRELAWLRGHGIVVRGVASHGSPFCHRLGYHNDYFWENFPRPVAGFPNLTRVGDCVIAKARLADYGLEYDAYHVPYDRHFSDSSFAGGSRWHPDGFLGEARPGERVVVLVHPCHWDRSPLAKAARLAGKLGRKAARVRRPRLRADARPASPR